MAETGSRKQHYEGKYVPAVAAYRFTKARNLTSVDPDRKLMSGKSYLTLSWEVEKKVFPLKDDTLIQRA